MKDHNDRGCNASFQGTKINGQSLDLLTLIDYIKRTNNIRVCECSDWEMTERPDSHLIIKGSQVLVCNKKDNDDIELKLGSVNRTVLFCPFCGDINRDFKDEVLSILNKNS